MTPAATAAIGTAPCEHDLASPHPAQSERPAHVDNDGSAGHDAAAPSRSEAGAQAAAQPFREFCAQHLGSPVPITAALASQRLGQAWAQAVVMHWSRLQRQGGIDLSQPLYVLDLAPGDGSLAACVMPALWAMLQGHGMQDWPVHYLACVAGADQRAGVAQGLSQQPGLAIHQSAGRLLLAQWPARTGQPLLLGEQRAPLFGARNPLIVLMAGGWSAQPAELHALHWGQHLTARVQVDALDASEWCYEWDEATPALSASADVLMARYSAGLPSAPLLLSEAALAQIDAVADFSAGRYLLLAADMGVVTEAQIRAGGLLPATQGAAGQWWLPVNFHALGEHQRMNGAWVADAQPDDQGWVLQVACRDDVFGFDAPAWLAMVQAVQAAHPDDHAHDLALPAGLAQASQLEALALDRYLRRNSHEASALAELLQALPSAPLHAEPAAAAALRQSLMLAWANTPLPLRTASLAMPLAAGLAALAAWGDARQVLSRNVGDNGAEQCELLLQRAEVDRASGHSARALRLAQEALQWQPDSEPAARLAAALRARLQAWLQSPWYLHEHMREGNLCLERVDASHHAATAHQRRDPQIAQMARLPDLGAPGQAEDDGAVRYALMHSDWGLVGAVGFHAHDGQAFFHLWIGTDFQGHGLGTRAVALLLAVLQAGATREVFTAVYRFNGRCLRILQRLGFATLDFHRAADDDGDADVVYLHKRLSGGEGDAAVASTPATQRLRRLCEWLDTAAAPTAPPITAPT